MKALSIRQPWAWAILHAGKRIENRSWNTRYRGPVLIHAAKGMTHDELVEAEWWMRDRGLIRDAIPRDQIIRAGIIGVADLVDVVRPDGTGANVDPELLRWHMVGQYGFVLANVRPVDFFPCAGKLGFFKVEGVRL